MERLYINLWRCLLYPKTPMEDFSFQLYGFQIFGYFNIRILSRVDNDQPVLFNIHEGLDSTLLILKHRLKANETRPEIEVVKVLTGDKVVKQLVS